MLKGIAARGLSGACRVIVKAFSTSGNSLPPYPPEALSMIKRSGGDAVGAISPSGRVSEVRVVRKRRGNLF